jgi:Flp pilus assembly pilin Flp
VEYGLIAGLIALGILGSLVGTRGSLNAVFGLTSSSLGQSTMTHPKQPDSANASYWASKTLVSTSSSNVSATGGSYTYTYSDGTVVSYTVGWKPDGSFNGESISISRNAGGYQPTLDNLTVNAAGQATSISKYVYYNYSTTVASISDASGSPSDGDWPGNYRTFQQNGSFSSQCNGGRCYDPTISTRATAAQDPLYFRGLVAQM